MRVVDELDMGVDKRGRFIQERRIRTMARIRRRTAVGVVTLALLLSQAPLATAVPMWSRRYSLPCSTCHAYPSLQLTASGLDFFRRGHRFSGDALEKNFANLLSAHGEVEQTAEKRTSTEFQETELHLHAGGAISSLFSAYLDDNVKGDFEAIYLQFTKSQGDDIYFTTRDGKIAPTIIRNFANGLMASASTPLIITDATLADNPFTPARDNFGIDVAQRWKSFFFQGGVLNGEDVPGQAEVDNHKDVYLSAELDATTQPTGIGLYYHRGGYDLLASAPTALFDRYDRAAIFANWTRERFRVAVAYLHGQDHVRALPERRISGYYAQGDLHTADWAVPFARYDWARTEEPGATDHARQGTVGCAFSLFQTDATAARVVVETSRRREAGQSVGSGLLSLLWAF